MAGLGWVSVSFLTLLAALFRHASLRLSNRETAIEVVHDTFVKTWSYIRSGHNIKEFRPFLYKVLNNLIIDEYRQRSSSSLDEMLEAGKINKDTFLEELSESTIEAVAATIDGKKAFDLLNQLSDDHRRVIVMRFIDELGPKEISMLLGVSENVVSVRLNRALGKLRELINNKNKVADNNVKEALAQPNPAIN